MKNFKFFKHGIAGVLSICFAAVLAMSPVVTKADEGNAETVQVSNENKITALADLEVKPDATSPMFYGQQLTPSFSQNVEKYSVTYCCYAKQLEVSFSRLETTDTVWVNDSVVTGDSVILKVDGKESTIRIKVASNDAQDSAVTYEIATTMLHPDAVGDTNSDGSSYMMCNWCGTIFEGCKYSEWTSENETYHIRTGKTASGQIEERAEHTYDMDRGIIIKAPTETEEGTAEYYCTTCHHAETVTIPALGMSDDPDEILSGDLDLNGSVELLDANLALKASLNIITLEGTAFTAADIDKDGVITLNDAKTVLHLSLSCPLLPN